MRKMKQFLSVLCILGLLLVGCQSNGQEVVESDAAESSVQAEESSQAESNQTTDAGESETSEEVVSAEPQVYKYTTKFFPEEMTTAESVQTVRWLYFESLATMHDSKIEALNQQLADEGVAVQIVQIKSSESPSIEDIRQIEQDLGCTFDIVTFNVSNMSNADFAENFEKLNDHLAEDGALADAYAVFSEDVWKLSDMDGAYYNLHNFAQFTVPSYLIYYLEGYEPGIDTEKWQNQPWELAEDLLDEIYELNGNEAYMIARDQLPIGYMVQFEPQTVSVGNGFRVTQDGQVETLLDTSYRYWSCLERWMEKGYMADKLSAQNVMDNKYAMRLFLDMDVDYPTTAEFSLAIPMGNTVYAERCEVYTSVLQSAPAKEAALKALNLMLSDAEAAKALYYGSHDAENRYFTGIDLLTRGALVPDEETKYFDYDSYTDYVEDMTVKAEVSPWHTFLIDDDAIDAELADVEAFLLSLDETTIPGYATEWAVAYDSYIERMEALQLSSVKAEIQKQIDAWAE